MPIPSAAAARLRVIAALCLGSLAVSGCSAQRPAPPQPRAAARTNTGSGAASGAQKATVPHTLMDDGWGLPWGTVTLPAGWGFNGGVVHGGQSCFASSDSPMWSAASPDRQSGFVILPILKTGYTSDRNVMAQMQAAHCPLLRSTSAADYLTQYVLPQMHGGSSNFHVLSSGPEPQLEAQAAQFRQMSAQLEQVGNNQFSRLKVTVETARVLLQYQQNGHTVNEVASAIFSCNHSLIAMPMTGRTEMLDCFAPVTSIAHTPDDGTPFDNAHLEAKKDDPPPFSMAQNPAWTARFQQIAQAQNQQLQQQHQQNMQNLNDSFARNQAAHQAQMQGYAQHNAAMAAQSNAIHNSNQAYAMHMGDSNIYTNPQTGQQVQLSNQYNNTYVNGDGTVALQTNSAYSPGVDWTLLQPKF